MKVILVLCSTFAVAFAGVGVLSPQDEDNALQLFHQVCGQGQTEGQNFGGMTIFCKSARDDFQETVTHQVRVPASPQRQAQVIFVQPPMVRYQHNVQLLGSAGQGQQAKIFVLPQRATHQIAAQYNPGPNSQVKPVVYFLNSKATQQQQSPPPPPQRPQYGPPANNVQEPPQQQYGPPPQEYGVPPQQQQQPQQNQPQQYGPPPQQNQPQQYGPPPQQYGNIPVHVSQPAPQPQYAPGAQQHYIPQGYRYSVSVPDNGPPQQGYL